MASNRKYRWEQWFAQRRVVLVRGIHYECSTSMMQQQVRNAASLRGLRVRVTDQEGSILVEVLGDVTGRVLPNGGD